MGLGYGGCEPSASNEGAVTALLRMAFRLLRSGAEPMLWYR